MKALQDTIALYEDIFYLGHEKLVCPYLPDREARFLVVLGSPLSEIYHNLMDEGYRRQGKIMYRPDCHGCTECQVLRIPVQEFQPSRSQRRVKNRGDRTFRSQFGPLRFTPDRFRCYRKFVTARFADREMPVPREYREFFLSTCLGQSSTIEHALYHGNRLVGAGILDVSGPALSSVYFYFDPDYSAYSPGVYSVLKELEYASNTGLEYYYPGYYIEENSSMNYKAKYRPAWIRRSGEPDWRVLHK